jgi:tRNA pseudouridine55 synthase
VSAVDGVLVVDKPGGPTSHDVVDQVRQALGTRRVGHTGTLDPFATGVLAVCVGKATRLSRFLMEGEKGYVAGVRFGFATTTDDFTGEPVGAPVHVALDPVTLATAVRSFVGPLAQVPPAYSAKRVGGRKMYELARRGEAVPERASSVVIHEIRVDRIEGDVAWLDVRCSAGTYVRALARDLGTALGLGGHLAALRRTRSGEFGLKDAVPWHDLGPLSRERLIPTGQLLTALPGARVDAAGLDAVRHGRVVERAHLLAPEEFPEGLRVRVVGPGGELLALALARAGNRLHADVVLAD